MNADEWCDTRDLQVKVALLTRDRERLIKALRDLLDDYDNPDYIARARAVLAEVDPSGGPT